ncbi:MAG: DUF4153 domain-containing protein [Dokdonia sp.]
MIRQLLCILAALLFSTLFYQQDLGLNMLLFAICSTAMLFLLKPATRDHKVIWILAGTYLLSAGFVFFHSSALAIFNTFLTFLIFVGASTATSNSVYVQWFNGMYQAAVGQMHAVIHASNQAKQAPNRPHKIYDLKFVILSLLLISGLVAVFGGLYSQANPVFAKGFDFIDLSFINFYWILFALMGYLLLLNCTATAQLEVVVKAENSTSTHLRKRTITPAQSKLLVKEYHLAILVISALLLLIFGYILADMYLVFWTPLELGPALSQAVHTGINALITSIVLAILLILIFFRGNLNFYKKNHTLKTLTYLWLLANLIIVGMTAYKNIVYCEALGLTYKRIGVFVYLFLSAVGLMTTYVKISQKQTVYQLLRINTRIGFFVLVILASFSWDRTITQFNLSYIDRPDMQYLLSLSRSNSDLLYAYAKKHPEQIDDASRIEKRNYYYLKQLTNQTWQARTLTGIRLLHAPKIIENK